MSSIDTEYMFSHVPALNVHNVWPLVQQPISSVLANNIAFTAQGVHDSLVAGSNTLWLRHAKDNQRDIAACYVTTFAQYDTGLFLVVFICSAMNDHDFNYAATVEFFTELGKSCGAVGWEVVGRSGWGKKYPQLRREGTVFRSLF